ncbi:flagellar biosynthesis protein FlhB [Legionella jamestowniensis]|uniref:Flagellar biosynthetic protein FlhB n=1 Tax=Legionella jamestowniensis TaxID=455 RepID=A0A0W0UWY2_9GAMM|nr:flagellar biosynthesis protein FlhB [Legionella jamestowniensis]KTD12157.1 flagellar biosynthetic protein FlhB [Legionella jamestowniensis]OCH98629.1 flagellar biosynthesis protein FlhB [Legionella jamestowniensis]SFL75231.1 flagellar biosynthetic protein FlhB [Legionella jamestowniensis DSM 19215]
MADEEQSQEKTEQPSPKRLKEAREKGQVARSKDFNATLILLSSGSGIFLFGSYIAEQLMQMMRQAFDFNNQILKTPLVLLGQLYLIIREGFWAILPLLLLILVLSACAPLLMGGWVFSAEVLQPKLSRLNPLKGFKRMFSLKGAVEMAKALVKFLLVVTVAIVVLRWKITFLLSLADFSLSNAISSGLTTVAQCFLLISASLILIAAVDVPFQWHEHNKQLKMTKQELKDEYKETEGKPEVKSHIRKMQQEMARKRMMSEVPKADVVLTNPTHYAVALNYKQQGKKAPVVVAKGKDLIALQINRVAQANNVPSLAVPALTRAIYFSTELNAEIPRGLYVAVAQVLAYIFQLKDKKYYDKNPEFLQNLPIPDEFNRTKKSKTIS